MVDKETRDEFLRDAENGSNARITINLKDQEIIRPNGVKVSFEIDGYKKHCLIEGLDDIAVTLDKNAQIDTFEIETAQKFPWL
jgi:3-isopropylmalate/(R)-2-methylmalate dehydratase small subunit